MHRDKSTRRRRRRQQQQHDTEGLRWYFDVHRPVYSRFKHHRFDPKDDEEEAQCTMVLNGIVHLLLNRIISTIVAGIYSYHMLITRYVMIANFYFYNLLLW